MGVPAFFRWLSRKYPSILCDAVEERKQDGSGERVPVDATQPNPNYQEFDNLYLDMNAIIHPCTHPEDRPAPKTEEEMFILIFQHIDRLFSIVRPRRLLYMAIDGVAPRAKMNQQRSRRFRAAKEATDRKDEVAQMRKKLEEEGVPLPPPRAEEEHFDSNCITPGTPFMARLAVALRYYIHERVTNDPAWQKIQVILSDASVPGEGEHKIMDYIRRQRASPSHDPNTVHCLCGADADLIMLGLATHEANFNIIREEFVPNQPKACELCNQYGHELKQCQGLANREQGPDQADPLKKEKNFIFIRLPVLREYLERELQMPNLPFEYDFERVIDDWVFMCFFVGNDFLPHLPSLEIREGAIDRLIKLYKNMVYEVKGWLTQEGEVFCDRVQMIMVELGKAEDEIFRNRHIRETQQRRSERERRRRGRGGGGQWGGGPRYLPQSHFSQLMEPHRPTPRGQQPQQPHRSGAETRRLAAEQRELEMQRCAEATEKLRAILVPAGNRKRQHETTTGPKEKGKVDEGEGEGGATEIMEADGTATAATVAESSESESNSSGGPPPPKEAISTPTTTVSSSTSISVRSESEWMAVGGVMDNDSKQPRGGYGDRNGNAGNGGRGGGGGYADKAEDESDEEEDNDDIKLYEDGWKERYYQAKFSVSGENDEFRHEVALAYVEGLCWVLRYYYQGCPSWEWFFPYHYAPFASDFDAISDYTTDWPTATQPFKPLEQLMGVFPAASRDHIPKGWHWLMTSPESPIIHYYPQNFLVDLNGKKFAWQGVALLPFVDQKQLLSALSKVYHALTDEERLRNDKGPDLLFVGHNHPLYPSFLEVYEAGKEADFVVSEETRKWVYMDPKLANGMAGEIAWDADACPPGECYPSLFHNSIEFMDIKSNSCLMVDYRDPQFPADFIFRACRLAGVKEHERVLKPGDWDERRQGQYRPQIGFAGRDALPHARLAASGHRTLHASMQRQVWAGGSAPTAGLSYHNRVGPPPVPPQFNTPPFAPSAYGTPMYPLSAMMTPPPPLPGRGGGYAAAAAGSRRDGDGYHHHQPHHYQQQHHGGGGSYSAPQQQANYRAITGMQGGQHRGQRGQQHSAQPYGRPSHYQQPHRQAPLDIRRPNDETWRTDAAAGGGQHRRQHQHQQPAAQPPHPSQIPQPLSFAEMAMPGGGGGYSASWAQPGSSGAPSRGQHHSHRGGGGRVGGGGSRGSYGERRGR